MEIKSCMEYASGPTGGACQLLLWIRSQEQDWFLRCPTGHTPDKSPKLMDLLRRAGFLGESGMIKIALNWAWDKSVKTQADATRSIQEDERLTEILEDVKRTNACYIFGPGEVPREHFVEVFDRFPAE